MKNLIFAFCLLITGCSGCGGSYYGPPAVSGQYDYVQGAGGTNMVVIHDNGLDYMVDALLFSQLGYGGCVSYYHSHPGSYTRWNNSMYSSYRRMPSTYRPTFSRPYNNNSYRSSGGPVPGYTPRSPGPSRVTPSYQSRSISTPSTRSYSSPSRSYSSPSRSSGSSYRRR